MSSQSIFRTRYEIMFENVTCQFMIFFYKLCNAKFHQIATPKFPLRFFTILFFEQISFCANLTWATFKTINYIIAGNGGVLEAYMFIIWLIFLL